MCMHVSAWSSTSKTVRDKFLPRMHAYVCISVKCVSCISFYISISYVCGGTVFCKLNCILSQVSKLR